MEFILKLFYLYSFLIDMHPSEPTNLTGEVIDGTSVHLRWNPPTENFGFVLYYNVYYVPVGKADPDMVTTEKERHTFLLQNLKANTKWNIYVTSSGSHHESGQSNVITVETGEGTSITDGQGGKKNSGGMFYSISGLLS